MGHDHARLHKGDRCHSEPQVGGHQLSQGKGSGCCRARPLACKTSSPKVSQEAQGGGQLVDEPRSGAVRYHKGPFEGGLGSLPEGPAVAQDLNAASARAHSSLNLSVGELGGPLSASCPPCSSSTVHAASSAFVSEKPCSRPSCQRPRELGFRAFGLSLAARVVRSRGSFGAFLFASLHLPQDRPPRPAHALFPLPVPFPGCFQHIPSAKASRVRSRVASRRVAHVAVMACNFLFSGASFVPLDLLRHRPNKAQAAALSYVHKLCRACGAVEPFLVGSAGRRNLSLVSQLGELCEHLTLVGPSADPYGPSFHGAAPRLPSDLAAESSPLQKTASGGSRQAGPTQELLPSRSAHGDPLKPYAPLCADRLKISGLGHWDPVPFLSSDPDLQVAFLEPDLLLHGAEPPSEEVPDLSREKPGETLRLALKWAKQGLLFLKDDYSDQVLPEDSVRVFNCYKSSEADRQIGDRRSRNFRERALRGPSASLPCGPVFLGLCVNPATTTLRIAVADRKDFYHQLRVGPRKAAQNALFPPLFERDLVGTEAYDLLCRRRAASKPSSLLVPPPNRAKVVACFQAIFQGDHLGVEVVLPPEHVD